MTAASLPPSRSRGFRLVHRIGLISAFPLLGAAGLAVTLVAAQIGEMREAERSAAFATTAVDIGAIIHEAQKERAASTLAVGSKDISAQAEMRQQRSAVDREVAKVRAGGLVPAVLLRSVETAITRARSEIDRGTDRVGVIETGSAPISALIGGLADHPVDGHLGRLITDYTNLVEATEFAGQERAWGTAALASRESDLAPIPLSFVMTVSGLAGVQRRMLDEVATRDPAGLGSAVKPYASGSQELRALRMRIAEASGQGDPGLTIKEWRGTATARVDALFELQNKLGQAILATAATTRSAAITQTVTVSAALLVIFLFASGAAWFGARKIAGALGETEQAMRRLADGDLDTSVPGAGRTDEIGMMASAIEVFRESARTVRGLELAEKEAALTREARGPHDGRDRPRGG